MRRKFLATALALMAVAGAAVLSLASPASAQAGSGVGLCTTVSGIQNVGTVTVGQRFVLQLAPTCVFTTGQPITITVNGVNIPGKVANASGFVTIDVTVVSATQLSIDDPVLTPAICGTNTVVATGPSSTAQGGTSTQTATFTLTCTTVPVVATPIQGRLSLTGANSLRYAAVALALVAAGSMALVATRRRRANSTI
jgi:hypothetical protein